MSLKVLFGFFVFFVMYGNTEHTLENYVDTKNLVVALNALLSHKHWARITDVKAKLPDSTDQCYFSGKEIFIDSGLFARNRNAQNTCVSVDNVCEKYYQVISLLACVYACVIDKFTKLIKNLLDLSSNERALYRNRASKALMKNEASRQTTHRRNSDDSENDVHKPVVENQSDLQKGINVDGKRTNYENSLNVFNYTRQQFLNGLKMFEYMYEALSYLLSFVPRITYFSHLNIKDVQDFLLLVKWYKDVPINLNYLLHSYVGEHDVDYKSTLGRFSKILSSSIQHRNYHKWGPFVKKYCRFPVEANRPIKQILKKFKEDFPYAEKTQIMYQFGKQIDELINRVINSYYRHLGFVFSSSDNLYESLFF